ncbi:MAG: alpha-1,4-glucan--maltose-1-phosphate maltosyltransferase [Micrococcales bacterium]|nr:alpha-1,4-glucan--maltose-1-phosphate maltosyltransferase [Micrococcales bacterium]
MVDVQPVSEAGRFPAKSTVGEVFPVRATVFREGHDAYSAEAVLVRPDGTEASRTRMHEVGIGLDHYEALVRADATGAWTFRVESWSDPWATWVHDAGIKIPAGIDVDLMCLEGAAVLERAAAQRGVDPPDRSARAVLREGARALTDDGSSRTTAAVPATAPPTVVWLSAADRFAALMSGPVPQVMRRYPLRDRRTLSPDYPLRVERPLALAGAWYEMFPRSAGAHVDPATGQWVSGTLRTAADELPRIAAMGFDVVYLTPVHPIGTTFRKGRNNTLEAKPGDPGSPYAIGSPDGGHDAVEPSLGTFDDFDAFVARARELGMEVALDLALQCSPDHPWVAAHPQWFAHRADGSIAYAENPPKKYQDIYPLYFDADPKGLRCEIRRVIDVWIEHGVTAFRVDNPHTKPLPFWQRLLADLHHDHPDVLFLSEAFTRPAMMLTLAKCGFHQSYTYFAWRNTKPEVEEYLATVGSDQAAWMRPSFWPTTHDILTPYMQHGGVGAFAVRAVLAAMGSPTWGIYSGYELVENVPRPGYEEQVDNEKYEYKPRDWSEGDQYGIALLLGRLNEIRRAHPALRQLRNVRVHSTDNDAMVCFSRHLAPEHSSTGLRDVVVAVVNLDPFHTQEGWVHLDLAALGLPTDRGLTVVDELTGESHEWWCDNYVRLAPESSCAHIMTVSAP